MPVSTCLHALFGLFLLVKGFLSNLNPQRKLSSKPREQCKSSLLHFLITSFRPYVYVEKLEAAIRNPTPKYANPEQGLWFLLCAAK